MTVKELDEALDSYKKSEKDKIRAEKGRWRRFWLWIRYFFVITWKWLFMTLRDLRSWVIFAMTAIILSSEVWVPYLIGFIIPDTRSYLWPIASACWLFWLGPFTPFIPLCLVITIGVKMLIERIKKR